MRFYIASGLKNSSLVSELISFLEARGHICTYDWTENNDVRSEGEARMNEVSFSEASAVKDAELFIALMRQGDTYRARYRTGHARQQAHNALVRHRR